MGFKFKGCTEIVKDNFEIPLEIMPLYHFKKIPYFNSLSFQEFKKKYRLRNVTNFKIIARTENMNLPASEHIHVKCNTV